jgi:hypothetical protein
MASLRGIRLINAVEGGTVTGSQLETYLSDAGRLAEFKVLLSMRGQTRRIAASTTTMDAVILSSKAIAAIFTKASAQNSTACQAVVASPVAMASVSASLPALNTVIGNDISWNFFTGSASYQLNSKSAIALFAGVNPAEYATNDELILDPDSMANIAASSNAMKAVVASSPTVVTMSASSVAMALVADNNIAIGIVAETASAMPVIANSSIAMSEIISRAEAVALMAQNPAAMDAIYGGSNRLAFKNGPHFDANITNIIASLSGLNSDMYPSIASIIDDADALALVAERTGAMDALIYNSANVTYLANSANVGVVLASANAMAVVGPDTAAMGILLGTVAALPGLFGSALAKGYIFASTALIDTIAASSATVTWLTDNLAITGVPGALPDANATNFQPFIGGPSKMLILAVKQNSAVATFAEYQFSGSVQYGSQAGAVLNLTGAFPATAHVAAYADTIWNLRAIAATEAAKPLTTYVDMT